MWKRCTSLFIMAEKGYLTHLYNINEKWYLNHLYNINEKWYFTLLWLKRHTSPYYNGWKGLSHLIIMAERGYLTFYNGWKGDALWLFYSWKYLICSWSVLKYLTFYNDWKGVPHLFIMAEKVIVLFLMAVTWTPKTEHFYFISVC